MKKKSLLCKGSPTAISVLQLYFTSCKKMMKCSYPIILCLFGLYSSYSQSPALELRPVIENITSVVDIASPYDGTNRLFLLQQTGTIKVYDHSFSFLGNFLTVSDVNSDGIERGLLSIAFPPNYASSGYFFVYYTAGVNGDITIARYSRSASDPNVADPSSKVILMQIPKPLKLDGSNQPDESHNGGKLNFGPEGYLYFATGDGGSGYDVYDNALNGHTLLGKMLRIDVNVNTPPYYSIPPENPYVSDTAVRDEIWAMGFRNPWRWSFDRQTHDMWIGDVGQRDREEIDFLPAGSAGGSNFGWHCYEGMIPTPTLPPCTVNNYVPPIYDYMHNASGGQAVVGGYVYRGTEFPALVGYYVAGDYVSRNVFTIRRNTSTGNWIVSVQKILPSTIRTFGEAEDGNLYVAGNDAVYKLQPATSLPLKLVSFTLRQAENFNDLSWKTASEFKVKEFAMQYSGDAIDFSDITTIGSSNNQNGSAYSFRHFTNNDKKIYYRLKSTDYDGHVEFSRIISTSHSGTVNDALTIYQKAGQSLQVQIGAGFHSFRIVNFVGQIMHNENIGGQSGLYYVNSSQWPKGVYILVADGTHQLSKRFMIQ